MKKPKTGDKVVFISVRHPAFLGEIGEVKETTSWGESNIIAVFKGQNILLHEPYKEISRHLWLSKPLKGLARLMQYVGGEDKQTNKRQASVIVGCIAVIAGTALIHEGLAIASIGAILIAYGKQTNN